MTTFTTDDREEEYKQIVAAAPNQPGYEDAVDPVAYINKEDGLVCAKCYKPFIKELTDDEIADLIKATNDETGFRHIRIFDFVKVLLRKARET